MKCGIWIEKQACGESTDCQRWYRTLDVSTHVENYQLMCRAYPWQKRSECHDVVSAEYQKFEEERNPEGKALACSRLKHTSLIIR